MTWPHKVTFTRKEVVENMRMTVKLSRQQCGTSNHNNNKMIMIIIINMSSFVPFLAVVVMVMTNWLNRLASYRMDVCMTPLPRRIDQASFPTLAKCMVALVDRS